MNTLKIWYKGKHDDYSVDTVKVAMSPADFMRQANKDGFIYINNTFIPYHCVSTVEIAK